MEFSIFAFEKILYVLHGCVFVMNQLPVVNIFADRSDLLIRLWNLSFFVQEMCAHTVHELYVIYLRQVSTLLFSNMLVQAYCMFRL